MKLREIAVPSIGPNDILIKVAKTSVNFADIKKRNGNKTGKVPFIPGLDCAGTVEAIGSNVEKFSLSQRVIAFPPNGSYAEYVVAPESLSFAIPDNVDFTTAAACPTVSFLSHKLLHDVAKIRKGEIVVVHAAAGGVGTTAIQLAKLLDASTVIGTVSSEEKFATAYNVGADHVITYSDFSEKVNEITNGLGADIILDSISGKIAEESMKCLALYGRLIHFGNSSGDMGHFETKKLHASCRSVLGFSLGTTRKERPDLLKDTAEQVFHYIAERKLSIHIGHEFALANASDAHRLIESRKSSGKILLQVGD